MKVYCLHQLCTPSDETKMGMNKAGRGNCFECTPDWNNHFCTHFQPVALCTMEVLEETGLLEDDFDWNRAGEWW